MSAEVSSVEVEKDVEGGDGGMEVLSAEYVSTAAGASELVPRLKEIHEVLKEMEQGVRSDGLLGCSLELAEDRLLKSHSKEVRVLLACCLADVLRIFAPNIPYGDVKVKAVFNFLVRQLRGIEDVDGPFWSWTYYLLEKLALVKVFVVVADDETIITKTFDCFYSCVLENHSHKVITQMQDIMITIVEETTQPVPQWLIESLLRPLVIDPRPQSTELAYVILRRCNTTLQSPVSNFLNSLLAQDATALQSELADHRGDLIVYLNRVSSDFLLYVIPNLERELLSRDASRRTETISVIGRIFTDEESSAVRDYGALLRRFATRMSDIEPSIRRQTCTFVTSIVQKHPQTSEELFPRLEVRLLDGEVEVRKAAVEAVFSLAEYAPTKALVEAAGRTMDKDISTRRMAIHGLTKFLAAEVEKNEPLDDKFSWMPGSLVRTSKTLANTGDLESLHLIEKAIFETFLINLESAEERAVAWLRLFEKMDETQRGFLLDLMSTRATFRKLFLATIRQLCAPQSAEDGRVEEEETKSAGPDRKRKDGMDVDVSAGIHSLSKLMPMVSGPRGKEVAPLKLLKQLFSLDDEQLYRQLELLCDGKTNWKAAAVAKVEVLSCLEDHLELQSFVTEYLIPRYRSGILSEEHLNAVTEIAAKHKDESQALQNFAAWFLSKAAPLYPEEFEGVSENVADLLLNTETITLALRVLSSMGECFRVRSSKLMLVNEKLAELTLSADVQDEAKWAARALTRMNGDDVTLPVWVQLLPTLRQRLSNFEHDLQLESVAGALMTFSQFASKSPAVWTACEEEAVDFSFKLLNGEFALTVEKGSNFAQCTACAIKVLSHSVAARARSGADPKPHEDQRICSLLLRTIKKVGDVYEVCNGNEDESFEDTECAAVRLAAASAVLRISRSLGKKAFHVLSPNDYLMTALTAQDANPDVRLTFARKIYTGILHKKLQLRWVVGLILMAIDPDRQNMESVKKYTATLVKIWKMKVEDFKRTEKTEDIRSILPLLPECVLPSVVWILAHHPDIKLDADSGFPETKKYLEFFFSRLLAQTDYASFLVQILQTIALADDATDPPAEETEGNSDEKGGVGTVMTRAVASIGLEILHGMQSGRKWNLTQYPGRFYLPEELYKTKKVGKSLRRAAKELDRAHRIATGSTTVSKQGEQVGEKDARQRQQIEERHGRPRRTRRREKTELSGDETEEKEDDAVDERPEAEATGTSVKEAEKEEPAEDTIAGRAARRRRVNPPAVDKKTSSPLDEGNGENGKVPGRGEEIAPPENDEESKAAEGSNQNGEEGDAGGPPREPNEEQTTVDTLLPKEVVEKENIDRGSNRSKKAVVTTEKVDSQPRSRKRLTPTDAPETIDSQSSTMKDAPNISNTTASTQPRGSRSTPRRAIKRPKRYDSDDEAAPRTGSTTRPQTHTRT